MFSLRMAATSGLFDDGFGDIALMYGRGKRAVYGFADLNQTRSFAGP